MKGKTSSFAALEPALHPLVLRSLSALSFPEATPIQATLIPLALSSNQDILARARTGSGKTLSYAIPIVHGILQDRERRKSEVNGVHAGTSGSIATDPVQCTKALILVPTRELAEQVRGQIGDLIEGLGLSGGKGNQISIANVAGGDAGRKKRSVGSGKSSERSEKLQLSDRPEIVVATPSRALAYLRQDALHLEDISYLVIDEADLILSYGHSSEDIRSLLSGPWKLPAVYQSFLMSATMTGEVEELKGIVLRNPVILKLEEDESELANLSQYVVRCSEEDKFLLIYVILKLKLIKGKCLIFVNDTDRGYRVKLFLEKFGIKSGVLNSELPFNSRYHAVQEFNRGVFDYLIATDESGLEGHDRDTVEERESSTNGDTGQEDDGPKLITTQPALNEVSSLEFSKQESTDQASTKKRKRSKEASVKSSTTEYGVSRGVDFIDVACVINFDLPFSSRSYTHRVGRTARAGRTGTSLSFVVPKSLWGANKKNDISLESAKRDEQIWKRIEQTQKSKGGDTKEYKFDMKQVEGFRYRMDDGLRSVTKAAVREARIKEIKNEIVNSEKLKAHFEDNPKDLAFLRHDKPLHPARVQSHLKHVPSYLMPRIASVDANVDPSVSPDHSISNGEINRINVPFHKPSRGRGGRRGGKTGRGGHQSTGGRRADPLKGGKFAFKST